MNRVAADPELQNGGMSRAAKKRAKKKHKRSSEAVAVETSIMPKSSIDDTIVNVKTTSYQGNGSFSNKRIKSIIKDVSSKMGVGGLDDDEVDVNDKRSSGSTRDEGNWETSIAEETLVEIPPKQSLSSLLMANPSDTDIPKGEDTKLVLEGLSAKQRGAWLLQTMVAPTSLGEFYKSYWEKRPLLVRATNDNRQRFENLLSLESIMATTKKCELFYGQDLNVTKYKKSDDGVKRRMTLDRLPEDGDDTAVKVNVSELWSNYEKGCTIRLLCPQKYYDNVHALLSNLETELHCMVGANAYLTPPNSSQGFAPHYDDIEAFILQLEGKKRWKVYKPTLELPRTSSEDFTAQDLREMKQQFDVTLEEGDMLYMPRGWIHQACTLKDSSHHSLHLTVSAMQQWAWVDLMEVVIPDALQAAAINNESVVLRQGLPRGFVDFMGVMYEDTKDDNLPESLKRVAEEEASENPKKKERKILRERFRTEARKRVMQIAETAMEMIDATCDQMAKRFISERQPPALLPHEKNQTSQGDGTADEKDILPNTMCRLVRPGVGRLVVEDDKAVVYHCADNSRAYLGNALSPLEFEMDDGPALEQLLTTIEPDWILVNDLFHDTIEDKIAVTRALYDEGILAIKQTEETA